MNSKISQAMIFAAGLGRRLKPFTDKHPKALFPINNVPLLEYTIRKMSSFGIENIIINVHHFSEQIIEFLNKNNNFGLNIIISDETNLLLDTGGGLKKAYTYINNAPLLLYNVDIISNINFDLMFKKHNENKSIATLAVQNRSSTRYLLFDEEKKLIGRINKDTAHTLVNNFFKFAFSGIHILDYQIIELLKKYDSDIFSIIDFYLSIMNTHSISFYEHTQDEWLDCGKYEEMKTYL